MIIILVAISKYGLRARWIIRVHKLSATISSKLFDYDASTRKSTMCCNQTINHDFLPGSSKHAWKEERSHFISN